MLTEGQKQQVQALREQFDSLDTDEWAENKKKAQQRGLQFESLVQDLFEVHGLLLRRSYRTQDNQSEQIDGAVQFSRRHTLLESKWVESGLAASELFAFLGKVEGKFVGTIGIFVSRLELSKNFLGALRSGRRQSVMVLHDTDIPHLFDPTFPLEEYLEAHLSHIAIDNACHYSADRFLDERKVDKAAEAEAPAAGGPPPPPADAAVTEKFKECISKAAAKNLVREYAEGFTPEQRVMAADRLVANYKTIAAARTGLEDSWKGQNLHRLLEEVVARLPNQWTEADRRFFVGSLSEDFQDGDYAQLLKDFVPRYQFISADERNTVENRLVTQWTDNFYLYDAENRLARSTELLWPVLKDATKVELMPFFVQIILSDRRPQYPQHQLARQIIQAEHDNPALQPAVETTFDSIIRQGAKGWVGSGWTDAEGRSMVINSLANANQAISPYVVGYTERIDLIVEEEQAAGAAQQQNANA